ncbi:MAG TPA: Maf family protein [Planctomycetota bacterium]|nr:Maf family protein [Planctomycetota bacterium]
MLALVLASASPRRRALLEAAGLEFTVQPADVDEDLGAFRDPERAALELALRKARAGAAAWMAEHRGAAQGACVIGADTIVAVQRGNEWTLLGKPSDVRDAEAMLALLSGTRHLVATAVALVRTSDQAERSGLERTFVTMREISAAERASYAASGEWEGKAGGYAIQESADRFVLRLEEGGFDNVVGLPVKLTLELLEELDPGRNPRLRAGRAP